MSVLVRECLTTAVEAPSNDHPLISTEDNKEMQKRLTVFTLFTHCLLEQFIKSTVQNGAQICNLAETKAEEMARAVLKNQQKK